MADKKVIHPPADDEWKRQASVLLNHHDALSDELWNLTDAEVQQLLNINSSTISAALWAGLVNKAATELITGGWKFGDSTNNTQFESDGTIKFNGTATVWRDEMNELIGKKLESPASDITIDETSSSLLFDDDSEVADYVMMNVQLNHDWKVGSSIYPHLHWRQGAAAYPNWLIQWRWQIQGQEETVSWQYRKVATHQFTWSAGTLNQISNFGAITAPAGAGISDIVQFRLIRDCSDTSTLYGDSDPLAGDASAVNFDVHIECDTVGSRSEFSK